MRWQTQCSVTEARAFALAILEAAEAAETDELLLAWLAEKVGIELEKAVGLLADLRTMRDARRGGQKDA